MITTRIKGGLGNQIFQFHAGLYLAELNQSTPFFYFNDDVKGAFQHGDTLLDLDFGLNLKRVSELKKSNLNSKISRFLSLNYPRLYCPSSKIWGTYHSNQTGFDIHLQHLRGNQILEGYFQTYKYFEYLKSKSIVTGYFYPKKMSSSALQLRLELRKDNPIIMHVRRGDYVSNQNAGLLSRGYYFESLGKLYSTNRPVWVFSDDTDLAKREFSMMQRKKWRWVGPNHLGGAAETLYLMSLSRDIVIGNSTFSYWAAMLNEQKNVVAPCKWQKMMENPQDLYPESWQIATATWVDS